MQFSHAIALITNEEVVVQHRMEEYGSCVERVVKSLCSKCFTIIPRDVYLWTLVINKHHLQEEEEEEEKEEVYLWWYDVLTSFLLGEICMAG